METKLLSAWPLHSAFLWYYFRINTFVSAIYPVNVPLPFQHVSLVFNAYWVNFHRVWLINMDCIVTHPSPAQQDAKVTAPQLQLLEVSTKCAPKTSGSCSEKTNLNKPDWQLINIEIFCNVTFYRPPWLQVHTSTLIRFTSPWQNWSKDRV